ncbi:MAG: hypothetical protein AAFR23_10205, partial [Pseudomonadota bacterium]
MKLLFGRSNAREAITPDRRPQSVQSRKTPLIPRPIATAISIATGIIGTATSLILFFTSAIAIGIASAWFAIQSGTPFNTERSGPWTAWTFASEL